MIQVRLQDSTLGIDNSQFMMLKQRFPFDPTINDRLWGMAVGSDGIVWTTLDYNDLNSYDKLVRLDPTEWTGQYL